MKSFISTIAAAALLAVLLATPLSAQQVPGSTSLAPNASSLGLVVVHKMSAATTNSTLTLAGQHALYGFSVSNTSGASAFIKFYNKATAPTCGTDTPVFTFGPIAATTGQVTKGFIVPLVFLKGLGWCLTGAIADADTTATATGISVDLAVK